MGYRVFIAAAKDADPEKVDAIAEVAREKFGAALSERGIDGLEVVKASDDFNANFARCGSWDAWINDVARGVDYMFRTPRYNAIVVLTEYVGKATGSIVRIALQNDRMVILMGENGGSERVMGIEEIDPNDYKGGWRVVLDN
jgi:hypothetical protein